MKTNMNDSCIELNDLPDEILQIIFKKLNNLEVLYSLQGVNQRLNNIIYDSIFTSHLNFVKWSSDKFINKYPRNILLDRFCLQILPKIHMKIKCLDIESSSVKDILHAADYPHLYRLGLYNIEDETATSLFTDERLINGIFKNQITSLVITIDSKRNELWTVDKVCNDIFTVFKSLTHLKFSESSYKNIVRLIFDFPSPSLFSSTLLVLNIKIQSFHVCLYLLDGRFNQLHTLIVELCHLHPSEDIENQGEIPNLRCFFLSCVTETCYYYKLILPLLYRMTNLEKLGLYFSTHGSTGFIDGNNLKKNIINRMSRLHQFTFDIRSVTYINHTMNLPSKEDIQHTFRDFQYTQIISYVDYFPKQKQGQCHVYSYPSIMEYYEDITNNFPGGLYKYVRVASLHDEERPFEHEFFIRISQSFPFMQKLSLINCQPQNYKQSYQSIVGYSDLTELDFYNSHDDYIEEFLSNTKTYFQNNILLYANYKSLQRVTHNFTRDDTRMNCAK